MEKQFDGSRKWKWLSKAQLRSRRQKLKQYQARLDTAEEAAGTTVQIVQHSRANVETNLAKATLLMVEAAKLMRAAHQSSNTMAGAAAASTEVIRSLVDDGPLATAAHQLTLVSPRSVSVMRRHVVLAPGTTGHVILLVYVHLGFP